MRTELKDVLHLYLGCKAEISNDKAKIVDNITPSTLTMMHGIHVKPILRPLSDMTDEEFAKCRKLEEDFGGRFKGGAQAFIWLLNEQFDMYGLIESGQAIDKTTLK